MKLVPLLLQIYDYRLKLQMIVIVERSQRLRDQQARLTGLDLRGNFEPGDSLVDKAVARYESDRLCYISWDACVSRDHEILIGLKRDTSLTFDSSGSLKLTKRDQVEPCNASNEIQVRYCLIRRGLALDQGNILCYKLHDRLAEKLMNCRMEEPPSGCMNRLKQQTKSFGPCSPRRLAMESSRGLMDVHVTNSLMLVSIVRSSSTCCSIVLVLLTLQQLQSKQMNMMNRS